MIIIWCSAESWANRLTVGPVDDSAYAAGLVRVGEHVPAGDQLGQHDEVGAEPSGPTDHVGDRRPVGLDILDRDPDLTDGDPHGPVRMLSGRQSSSVAVIITATGAR